MRLYEFADAEAQLALLRTIIDNTWTAIAQQAEQQKRVDAERKTQAKLKPRGKKSSKGTSIRIPTPPPPPTKKPQAPLAKQPPSPLNKPNPNALNAVQPLPSTNPQLKQQPTNTAINPKLASTPHPNPKATTPIKPSNGVKMGYFGKNIGATEKEDDGDDRHSKNGIATLKKTA
jgi:outer membrane biosynthesis protein TonB